MAKTDIPAKRLLQLRPEDWIRVTTGIEDQVRYRELKPDKNPKVESRLDSLYIVETEEENFILNLEPQGYVDPALPARMLRYRADIYESMMASGRKLPAMKQVVIYFSPYDETTDNKLLDQRFENSKLDYSYDVLRVWELDKDHIISNELYGLYSLLPLMKDDRPYNDEEILKEAVELALEIENKALATDILAAMSFLAEVQFSKDVITKYIRREMFMTSELWKEWSEEERKEGKLEGLKEGELKGKLEEVSNNIITVLSSRFGLIGEDLITEIKAISNKEVLDQLFNKSLNIDSLEDFEKILGKIN